MRTYKLYLKDILHAIKKIEKYARGLTFKRLKKEELVIDAIIRNLEIVGEAAKNIPTDIKQRGDEIEWKKVAGLRDILIHQYFGIDLAILWDIVKNKLPALKKQISRLLKSHR